MRANETWTMDFLQDALASGRKVRTLSIEDAYTREMLAILLSTQGFHAIAAEDGLEALHLLRTVRHRAPGE